MRQTPRGLGRVESAPRRWTQVGRHPANDAVTQRIAVRDDRRVGDGEQLLVRMNDDRDIANALKLSLANAPAYRAVPGFERSGALTVSCFAVADEIEAQIVVRGTRWSWYGLARASDLRALGCDLVATDVFDGDDLLPLSDRHIDAIVCPYPSDKADYATLTKAERSVLRSSLSDRFTAVLRAFDPRRTTGDQAERVS